MPVWVTSLQARPLPTVHRHGVTVAPKRFNSPSAQLATQAVAHAPLTTSHKALFAVTAALATFRSNLRSRAVMDANEAVIIRKNRSRSIPQAKRYRSTDWLASLRGMASSGILRRIRGPVSCMTVAAVITCALHMWLGPLGYFPELGMTGHSLLGSALGLLLVFRTNTAYSRFWEGRKIWEEILDMGRDLTRAAALFRDQMGLSKSARIIRLVQAFPFCMIEHLRGKAEPSLRAKLDRLLRDFDELLLGDDDLGLVSDGDLPDAVNRPLFIVNRLAATVATTQNDSAGFFTNRERIWLLSITNRMSRTIGACERLVQTPVPLSYVRHTSRFLSLFMLTLPWALVTQLGGLTIPLTCLVSWALFGILEIGLVIEDPFQGVIKLHIVADTLEHDVDETLRFLGAIDLLEATGASGEQQVGGAKVLPVGGLEQRHQEQQKRQEQQQQQQQQEQQPFPQQRRRHPLQSRTIADDMGGAMRGCLREENSICRDDCPIDGLRSDRVRGRNGEFTNTAHQKTSAATSSSPTLSTTPVTTARRDNVVSSAVREDQTGWSMDLTPRQSLDVSSDQEVIALTSVSNSASVSASVSVAPSTVESCVIAATTEFRFPMSPCPGGGEASESNREDERLRARLSALKAMQTMEATARKIATRSYSSVGHPPVQQRLQRPPVSGGSCGSGGGSGVATPSMPQDS
eukprot:TRINITY_DN25161_c0_g1_i1.p1 TRINITY_DN25161_c0_g1~~TRINITY_DN25161_c0_g1_i1.p1  ORF type:complete len:689 (-),score=99.96 TRINITY_DN25161_c0_g1_i1:32-2098(-)